MLSRIEIEDVFANLQNDNLQEALTNFLFKLLDSLNSISYNSNALTISGLDKYKGIYKQDDLRDILKNHDEFCFQFMTDGTLKLVYNHEGNLKSLTFT